MTSELIVRRDLTATSKRRIDEKVRAGRLHPVLPGIYSGTDQQTWQHRVEAALLARPKAVLHGPTAAKLTFWPELACDEVHLAPARFSKPPTWLKVSQQEFPEELVIRRGDLRLVSPAVATLQLSISIGPDAIDEALRRRAVTITHLREALKLWSGRSRNQLRARLLWESRDSPWSALERAGHTTLREARVRGWKANHRVTIRGRIYYIDIAFPGKRVAVELDGWAYHGDRQAAESDISRHNALQEEGWRVYRFGWHNLDELVPLLQRLRLAPSQQIAARRDVSPETQTKSPSESNPLGSVRSAPAEPGLERGCREPHPSLI